MILEEATKEAFGYYPSELTSKSNRPIIATCDDCGEVRTTSKNNYRPLCISCAQKGNKNCLGREYTEEIKQKISKALTGGFKRDENSNFKGGRKETFKRYRKTAKGKINNAKVHAKRKRQLGYTLLMPLEEGEVGHHFTNEYVIGIPMEVHEKLSGYKRKRHRALVLEWLKDNDIKKYEIALNVLKAM